MSCSIDDSNQATSLLIQSSQLDKAQASLSNTSTSSSSTPSSSSQNSVSNSHSPPSNLISLVTPLQSQNFQKINQSNSQQQQGPTKIVQAGTHYILTTVYQGNSGQKVVSVNPANNQSAQPLMLNSQNMASSSSVGSSSSASSNQNPSPLSDQQTTTITLTSPNLQSMQNPNQATIIFPLQTQQYPSYVDTNQTHNGQNVNLFSPLGTSSNNHYYTFQSVSLKIFFLSLKKITLFLKFHFNI